MTPPKVHNSLVPKDTEVYEVPDKETKPLFLQKINESQEKLEKLRKTAQDKETFKELEQWLSG